MIDESNTPTESSQAATDHTADDTAAPLVSSDVEAPVERPASATDPAAPDAEADASSSEAAEAPADEVPADDGGTDDGGTDEAEENTDHVDPNMDVAPLETAEDEAEERGSRDWYILKVQSNREDSIRDALMRRVKIEGLEDFFGEVIVPTEMVTEFKNGKKRIVKRKLYPGYIVVNMEINDDTWFLVRDTPGIGDFTGAGGRPVPMLAHEVNRLLKTEDDEVDEAPKLKIGFKVGERVKISEGNFENFEGEVEAIDEHNGKVTVMINIFGRSTPVELEYWQLEAL